MSRGIKAIQELPDRAPFEQKNDDKHLFSFIDLFAGIGGIRLAFQQSRDHCIFSSEWDRFAQKTYATNFGEFPHGDITDISARDIKSHLKKRPRKLTPRECANLQGFPDNFIINAVSDTQAYKQFGNSVAVPVVQKVAESMLVVLKTAKVKRK